VQKTSKTTAFFAQQFNQAAQTQKNKICCCIPRPGLPDGIFSNQKSQSGKILEGTSMKDIGTFYGHFIYFHLVCMYCGHLVYFMVIRNIFPVLVCCTRKNLATLA
jgi:hypothetical protein